MAPGFCPLLYGQSSCTKEVVTVTDYELITLFLMILALVVSLSNKNDR